MKKLISVLLIAVLFVAVFPLQIHAATAPTEVVNWDAYYAGATGNTGDMVVTKETDYLNCQVKTIASNATQRAVNFTLTSGVVNPGDNTLVRVVMRSIDAEGAFYVSYRNTSTGNEKSSAQFAVPTTWTEYFIPLASCGASPNRLIIRLGQKVQTIQIKDMQVINYGSLSLDTLPAGSRDATVAPVLDYEAYAAAVYPNDAKVMSVSQETGSGLYSNFVRLESKDVDPEAVDNSSRAANFKLNTGLIHASDVVLVRMVARAANADGSDGIMRIVLRDTTTKKESTPKVDYTVPTAWTEFYIPLKLSADATGDANRIYVRIGHKDQILEIADMEVINYGSTDIATLPDGQRLLESPPAQPPAEPVTKKDFTSSLTTDGRVTGKTSYSFAATDLDVTSGDMLMFSVVAKGENASCHVKLTAQFENASTSMEYALPVQATRINMPITADGKLKSFTLEALDGAVLLTEASVENRLTATQEDLMVESGMHMLENNFTTYTLSENGAGVGATTDLVSSGNYIYSIGSDKLVVTDMTDPNAPVVRGSVSGLGGTRQIALCASGTDVMVTSRGFGAWVINVSDPDKPVIRAHYDSVEMATGISIEGNYAYISCRQYGVDVVDLSNLDEPKHVCILRTGEVQSCKVVDNILYAGLWGECRVDMYDVADPANSVKLGSATLSGKGDGTAIYKKDGKTYLFAATGHHTPSLGTSTPLSDLRYGQGNGLDIYDVTDPANPVWLSTSKTDGRFYGPSYDYWSVALSEDENGKLFAYLSSTFNGAYVYEVSSMTAPQRRAHVIIEIPKTSANYKTWTDASRTVVYPFDRSQLNWGAVGDVAVEDGVLYLAGITTDLVMLQNSELFHTPVEQTNNTVINPSGDFYAFDGAGLEGYTAYSDDVQIHAVALHGNYVYAAASEKGILIFNQQLQLQASVATAGCCYDVYIRDGVLYAAEGLNGLVAYDIDGTSLTQKWRYDAGSEAVKQVRLSATGKFAALHLAGSRFRILRLTDMTVVINVKPGSQMYHHNVLNEVVGGRYICFWANSGDERWYDFGEGDSYDTPVQIHNFKPRTNMQGGIEAVGDLALATASNGYILYDPATVTDISSGLTVYKPGQNITGKPSEDRGTLITTNRFTGAIYIMDASTLTSPKLLKSFTVPGHPATAVYAEDAIYIPMGYQGLVKFDRAPFDTRATQAGLSLCYVQEGGGVIRVEVSLTGEKTVKSGQLTFTLSEGYAFRSDSLEKVGDVQVQGSLTDNVLFVTLEGSGMTAEDGTLFAFDIEGNATGGAVDASATMRQTDNTCNDWSAAFPVPLDKSLKLASAAMILHHNLGVNFMLNNSVLTQGGYTDPYVVFTFGDQKVIAEAYTQDTQNRLVFRFRDIAPHRIGDTITATVCATKDGVVYAGVPVCYSVKQYCYNTLAKYNDKDYPGTTYGELRTLLVDLLNYCSVAQQYVESADSLANAELTDAQKAWGTDTDPVVSTDAAKEDPMLTAPSVTWERVGLYLEESVGIRLCFAAENTDGLSVRFVRDDEVCEVTEFTPVEGAPGLYYVYYKDLNTAQMRKAISATVYQNGEQVSNTAYYSVEVYVANHIADTVTPYLAELVKAIIRFGDASYAYVN